MNTEDMKRLQAIEMHEAEPGEDEWLNEGYQISHEIAPLYAYITVKDGTLTIQHDTHEQYIVLDSVEEIDAAIAPLQRAKRSCERGCRDGY